MERGTRAASTFSFSVMTNLTGRAKLLLSRACKKASSPTRGSQWNPPVRISGPQTPLGSSSVGSTVAFAVMWNS